MSGGVDGTYTDVRIGYRSLFDNTLREGRRPVKNGIDSTRSQAKSRFTMIGNYVQGTFSRFVYSSDSQLSDRILRCFKWYRRRETLRRLDRLTGGAR